MLKIDHSNARKWSDATMPYPFIYEVKLNAHDIERYSLI